MTYDFMDDLPKPAAKPVKPAEEAEKASLVLDDIVLAPDDDILDIDDMLLSIDADPVTQAKPEVELVPAPAESVDPDVMDLGIQVELPPETDYSVEYRANDGDADVVRDEPVSFATLDADDEPVTPAPAGRRSVLEGTEPQVEKQQTALDKHKPKIVFAAIIAVLIGWSQYKKSEEQKAAQVAAANQSQGQIDPYKEAIKEIQTGTESVSHLPNPDWPEMGGASETGSATEPWVPVGGVPEVEAPAPQADSPLASEAGTQPVVDAAPVIPDAEVAPVAPVTEVVPVPEVAPVAPVTDVVEVVETPSGSQESEASTTNAEVEARWNGLSDAAPEQAAANEVIESLTKEVADLKKSLTEITQRAEKAERALAEAVKAATAKPASRAVTTSSAAKPVSKQQPVTSKQQPVKPKQESAARSDIKYIGSFLQGGDWRAHVIIGGNLYELSRGQKIAGLTVSAVNQDGVVLDAITYR
jgi:hypothetical protein